MNRTLKLELSANRKKILLANDIVPAAILLFTGLNSLKEGTHTSLALINILSGGLLLSFGVRAWRSLGRPVHHKVEWYDVVTGIVMMLDAWTMYKPWKGFQPAYLYSVLSLFYVLKGFSIIKPPGFFHRLTISDTGFTLRAGLFSSLHCMWEETIQIVLNDGILEIATPRGSRRISLKKIANRDEVLSTLTSSMPQNVQGGNSSA